MHYVLITGVSTGIGYTLAKVLIEKGFSVIGSVRKESDGERLEKELGSAFQFVIFDVTDAEAVKKGFEKVQVIVGEEGLYGLVNNAGVAVAGPLQYLSMESFEHQMNVNVTGLIRTTQAFLPLLGGHQKKYKSNPGRIINIGSVSGIIASPLLGAYSASKFAVEALSDSLRRELLLHDIKVILVQPGPIKTPIWSKSSEIDPELLETEYAPFLRQTARRTERTAASALEPEILAELIHKTLTIKNPRARYLITDRKWFFRLLPLVPDRWIDNMFHKSMKKTLAREKAAMV
ncbi:MAG: SDR family NAD(P)-dependent oxidoreductase [Saprospiraceae bacterium]|nr:SDR family NAD(P)-dependent oxidoreductase [Saprospiraceae bacterium]MCB9324052.1 SDR family NAD(P)-dependent oxidoreductase [Lewinellaceae bacterium]